MKKAHCMFMCCVDCFLVYSVKSGEDSFYRLTGLEPVSVLTGRISLMPR